ncbi:MAG: PAS domain-containing protein, partial [Vicinamibacterales bacterium]
MHDTHTPAEPDASQYARFFDAAPCAGWMFDARTLQIVHANRAAVDIYGFTRAEFLGMTLDQLAPDEDRAAVRRQLHEAPAGADGAAQRHCTRTGVIFGVQLRWVRPPGARRRAPAGTVVAWAERQAAAPEPVATRDEEVLAFREAPVGLLQLDDAGHIAGHIRRVNVAAATLLRASSSELSGRPFATLLHDDNETAAVPLLRVGDRWTG